jgi:hypothetical protein
MTQAQSILVRAGVLGLVAIGAYYLGQRRATAPLLAAAPSRPESAPLTGVAPSLASTSSAAERAQLREEIMSAVRAEIGRTAAASEPRAKEPEPATYEQQQAATQAQAQLDGAITRGTWGKADRDSFHALLPSLTSGDREFLLAAFARAINKGKLRVDLETPPL